MVLASTCDGTPIEDLAQLADKIVKVAVPPSISNVSALVQSSEIWQLWAEIASLTKVVLYPNNLNPTCLLAAIHQAQLVSHAHLQRTGTYAGIIKSLEIPLENASHPALSWEMTRPATDGGQCTWPSSKLLILCDWLLQWLPLPRQY